MIDVVKSYLKNISDKYNTYIMENVMSKKVMIGVTAVLFVALCVLIVCEMKWPTAGSDFFYGLF